MGYIVTERILKPWLFCDTVFALSALKTSQNECLKVLHDTTNSVIRKRRQELMAEQATQSTERSKEDECGKVWDGVQKSKQQPPLTLAIFPCMFSCIWQEMQCWAMTGEHYNGDCHRYGGDRSVFGIVTVRNLCLFWMMSGV